MRAFHIKTYKPVAEIPQHTIFILSKGLNSGKPLKAPCPNCFTVTAEDQEEAQALYWLSYALWKSNSLHPFLRGSVIPFIAIRDYRRQLQQAYLKAQHNEARMKKLVPAVQLIAEKEAHLKEQLKAIGQLRHLLLREFTG
jgi:hypothetical protein